MCATFCFVLSVDTTNACRLFWSIERQWQSTITASTLHSLKKARGFKSVSCWLQTLVNDNAHPTGGGGTVGVWIIGVASSKKSHCRALCVRSGTAVELKPRVTKDCVQVFNCWVYIARVPSRWGWVNWCGTSTLLKTFKEAGEALSN